MSAPQPFAARPLQPVDIPDALALAGSMGAPGVYLCNVLHAHPELGPEADILGFYGRDALLGLAYFGHRGNLVLLLPAALDPEEVAQAVLAQAGAWRIVLGPAEVVQALRRRGHLQPLVDRPQVYYQFPPGPLPPAEPEPEFRPARRKDLKLLMGMALELNRSDLSVDPWRVDRSWLRSNTWQRIKDHSTYVLGDPVQAKLDLGSHGPAGVVLEGVFTQPQLRGRGLARRLVQATAREVCREAPLVCLHVAEENTAARRAYAAAGMVEGPRCQLLLRG